MTARKSVFVLTATLVAVPVLLPVVVVASVALSTVAVGYVFLAATGGAIRTIVQAGKDEEHERNDLA